jgi:outer membrane protein assembly factor BamA
MNMARRVVVTIGLLAVSSGILIGAPIQAQVPSAPQSCFSPPVENTKLFVNVNGKLQTSHGNRDTSRKVIVDRIEFDRPVHLSNSDIEQVIEKANKSEWDADSPGWIDELAEIELRSAWQDQGYFKIAIDPHAQSIGGDSDHERFLVTVHVLNEGPQFHLGDIRFTGGTAIPEAELRQLFPLREGEFFDVAQAREGIVALTKLYGSHGFIDFTAIPDTEIDDNLQRISLVIRLEEQKQFRVGSVEIRGLDPSLETRLRSIVVPGEIFDPQTIETFFKENRPVLPPRGLDNFQIRRNVRAGIVDLTFDPRLCSDSE